MYIKYAPSRHKLISELFLLYYIEQIAMIIGEYNNRYNKLFRINNRIVWPLQTKIIKHQIFDNTYQLIDDDHYRNDCFDNSIVYESNKNKYISEFDILETLFNNLDSLTSIIDSYQAHNVYEMHSIYYTTFRDDIATHNPKDIRCCLLNIYKIIHVRFVLNKPDVYVYQLFILFKYITLFK